MITEVFIGNVKSEKFDYDIMVESGSYPEVIGKSTFDSVLFWDILKEDNKQTDWGCWVLKMNKQAIIDFLRKDKYSGNVAAKSLLKVANTLTDDKDYLLVAFEDIICDE